MQKIAVENSVLSEEHRVILQPIILRLFSLGHKSERLKELTDAFAKVTLQSLHVLSRPFVCELMELLSNDEKKVVLKKKKKKEGKKSNCLG